MRVLITGATGFAGPFVCERFLRGGHVVVAGVRSQAAAERLRSRMTMPARIAITGDLESTCDFGGAEIPAIDVLVHLAGRAHHVVESGGERDTLARYRRANVASTVHAIRAGRRIGCRRVIYVSSAKVHGDVSVRPFTEDDPPQPVGPYALSKVEAEDAARTATGENGIECVIVRPPLIYGPGVKANLATLLRLVNAGVPIPVSSTPNARSLISATNFASFLLHCSEHPDAPGESFLVSDDADLSTADVVAHLARGMHRKPRLATLPAGLLARICLATGQMGIHRRLFGSFQVDPGRAMRLLNWRPVESVAEGLGSMAAWFLNNPDLLKRQRPPDKTLCRYW